MAKYVRKDVVPVARLVSSEEKKPCAFCLREVDDEVIYGKLYAIGDIQCHYFCVLLSCCLVQKGRDHEGLFGFLYRDILIELERIKKHRCSYCGRGGANLGCSVGSCRKQFHLPCGREKNAVTLFYGSFKSYCQQHAPKQKLPDHILKNAIARKKNKLKHPTNEDSAMVCVICYEGVDGFPTLQTFWPPCCARDAWFHRSCLQRMCLSAGMHYLKCPLCNDKGCFYEAVMSQGYYVPDRDAAWELEHNAFSEIYERHLSCDVEVCKCPNGRNYDGETGEWELRWCVVCGGAGSHGACGGAVCRTCAGAPGVHALTERLHAIIEKEQAVSEVRCRRPTMTTRMSLRRTKGRNDINQPSSSRSNQFGDNNNSEIRPFKLKYQIKTRESRNNDILLSPLKLLEEELKTKSIDTETLEKVKEKIKKPRPLSVKKKLVNELIGSLHDNKEIENKQREPPKEWFSPKKCNDLQIDSENAQDAHSPFKTLSENLSTLQSITENNSDDSSTFELPPEFIGHDSEDGMNFENLKTKIVEIEKDSSLEISENNQSVNIDVFKITPRKVNVDLKDKSLCVEKFKEEYLCEINPNFKCNDHDIEKIEAKNIKNDIAPENSIKAKRQLTHDFGLCQNSDRVCPKTENDDVLKELDSFVDRNSDSAFESSDVLSHQKSDENSDDLSDKKFDDMSDKKFDDLSDKKFDDMSDKKFDDLSDKKFDDMSDKKFDDLSDKKLDDLSDKKFDDLSDKNFDDLSDKKLDDLSDKKFDDLSDKKFDDLSDKKPDDLSDKKSDGLFNEKTDVSSNQKSNKENLTAPCKNITNVKRGKKRKLSNDVDKLNKRQKRAIVSTDNIKTETDVTDIKIGAKIKNADLVQREKKKSNIKKSAKSKKAKTKSSRRLNVKTNEGKIQYSGRNKKSKKLKKINIKITFQSSDEKKSKTKLSIIDKKWRNKQLKLTNKQTDTKLKQCIIKFSKDKPISMQSNENVRPLLKKKYLKAEKSPDKLKQMSLHSFFKTG